MNRPTKAQNGMAVNETKCADSPDESLLSSDYVGQQCIFNYGNLVLQAQLAFLESRDLQLIG